MALPAVEHDELKESRRREYRKITNLEASLRVKIASLFAEGQALHTSITNDTDLDTEYRTQMLGTLVDLKTNFKAFVAGL